MSTFLLIATGAVIYVLLTLFAMAWFLNSGDETETKRVDQIDDATHGDLGGWKG